MWFPLLPIVFVASAIILRKSCEIRLCDTIIDVWNLLFKLHSACCTVNTSSQHKICANIGELTSSHLCFSDQNWAFLKCWQNQSPRLSSHCTCSTWFELIIYIYIHNWYVFETLIWTVWMSMAWIHVHLCIVYKMHKNIRAWRVIPHMYKSNIAFQQYSCAYIFSHLL